MTEDFLGARTPSLHETVYVASGAQIVGAVELAEEVSIWYNAVLRGDVELIIVGAHTNVQDGSVVHASYGFPVTLGAGLTVGHNAIIHGATVGNNTLVGMGAVLLDGVAVGENCIVAAGSLLTEGKRFPAGSLIMGTPGRVVRPLTEEEIARNRRSAEGYVRRAKHYREHEGTSIEL